MQRCPDGWQKDKYINCMPPPPTHTHCRRTWKAFADDGFWSAAGTTLQINPSHGTQGSCLACRKRLVGNALHRKDLFVDVLEVDVFRLQKDVAWNKTTTRAWVGANDK